MGVRGREAGLEACRRPHWRETAGLQKSDVKAHTGPVAGADGWISVEPSLEASLDLVHMVMDRTAAPTFLQARALQPYRF